MEGGYSGGVLSVLRERVTLLGGGGGVLSGFFGVDNAGGVVKVAGANKIC